MVMKIENIFKNKKWHLYHLRWQTSGIPVGFATYLCVSIFTPIIGSALAIAVGMVLGNFLGACGYWFLDKYLIFKKEK